MQYLNSNHAIVGMLIGDNAEIFRSQAVRPLVREIPVFVEQRIRLKETPAMASGLENHVWTIRELIEESAKL